MFKLMLRLMKKPKVMLISPRLLLSGRNNKKKRTLM
jgi:hypothetical protein